MKLSIIVPIYNQEKYILPCLRSILAQELAPEDREVLVVDDGSTDGSAERVGLFLEEKKEKNFRLLRQEHQGASAARRKGLEEAAGEWIGFVDADDRIEPAYYKTMLERASQAVDLVCSGYEARDERGRRKVYPGQKRKGTPRATLDWREARRQVMDRTGVYQYLCNKIFRHELLGEVDFPKGQFVGEDFWVLWHYLPLCRKVEVAPTTGYHYLFHGENTTRHLFDGARRIGFSRYRELQQTFYRDPAATAEERDALARYLTLEYMSFLLSMYRGGEYDPAVERAIIDFVRDHRSDYLRHGGDGVAARTFALLLAPESARLYRLLWPKKA